MASLQRCVNLTLPLYSLKTVIKMMPAACQVTAPHLHQSSCH